MILEDTKSSRLGISLVELMLHILSILQLQFLTQFFLTFRFQISFSG